MDIQSIQKAIAGEKLGGWLFFNFLHRDPLSDKILNIPSERINSRPWYYFVPACGEPIRICHAVEPGQLDDLPGALSMYSSREQLKKVIASTIEIHGNNWGAQFSKELTTVSTMDHGTALMLESAGVKLHSSAGLIQRLCGLLDAAGIDSHNRAAAELYEIIGLTWERIKTHFSADRASSLLSEGSPLSERSSLSEREIQQFILDEFERRGMVTEHYPIVASGPNSGNPHYAPEDHNNPILPDEVLQLDIWAKYKTPGSIYADISWLGFTGAAENIPEEVSKRFEAVRDARDRCTSFIDERLKSGRTVSGADADAETRKVLISRGFEHLIKHRTGHGIDTDVHGSGTGLDSVEFPDNRPLLEGSCFSVEPGLYSPEFGMRTEIDAYIEGGRLKVSGPGAQKQILTFGDF